MLSMGEETTTTTGKNLELCRLIWLDQKVNSNEENRLGQKRFADDFHSFHAFEEKETLLHFLAELRSSANEGVLLIVSGRLAEEVVQEIHSIETILFVFIFCGDRSRIGPWTEAFPKVSLSLVSLVGGIAERVPL